jgi:CRISPR-associated protein Csx14
MGELRIPMDPWNPGQFYACCGLIELWDAVSWFNTDPGRPRRADFVVEGSLDLQALLRDLQAADYEFDDDAEKSVWPVAFHFRGREIKLDWWLDTFHEKPERLKCWAGQVTTGKLIKELRGALEPHSVQDLFLHGRMMKDKFGIDPRPAWNALNVGFSPNEHGQGAATFPAVELLGAIGLQGFRPGGKGRDSVGYFLWGDKLPRLLARRAARSPWEGLAGAGYTFSIEKRGQSYKFFSFGKPRE